MQPNQERILKILGNQGPSIYNKIKWHEIDSKNFVYHLGQLMEQKFVKYNASQKTYELTVLGKKEFIKFDSYFEKGNPPINIFIGLFIEINNKIVVVERTKEPYINYIGIPVFQPKQEEFFKDSAKTYLNSLGLTGETYHAVLSETIYINEDKAQTHSNMHVFYCKNPQGKLIEMNSEGYLKLLSKKELKNTKKGYADSIRLLDYFKGYTPKSNSTITIISAKDTVAQF